MSSSMSLNHYSMRKSKKSYLDKFALRGHLRNFLVEFYFRKRKNNYFFTFDMESILFDEGELVTSTKIGNNITFYMDNVMRFWLIRNDMEYVQETRTNIREYKRFIKHMLKDQGLL